MKKFKVFVTIILVLAISLGVVYASPSSTTTTAQRNSIANNWSYYARGNYENNCLAYALGNTTQWIWPWGGSNPSLSQVNSYMSGYGYANVSPDAHGPLRATRVYAYGKSYAVTHFAKCTYWTFVIKDDKVRAKWGHCEIFDHDNADPYTSYPYGPLVQAYVK